MDYHLESPCKTLDLFVFLSSNSDYFPVPGPSTVYSIPLFLLQSIVHLQCILVIVDFTLDTRSLQITKFKRVNKEGEGLDAHEAAAIALLLCMV